MERPEFKHKSTHFKTCVGAAFTGLVPYLPFSEVFIWSTSMGFITPMTFISATTCWDHQNISISGLHPIQTQKLIFCSAIETLSFVFLLPSHCSTLQTHLPYKYLLLTLGNISPALQAGCTAPTMSMFTKGRGGECLTFVKAGLSCQASFRAKTMTDRQHKGWTQKGTAGAPQENNHEVKLYLPCEVLTRDRMKAGERLSQLWQGSGRN